MNKSPAHKGTNLTGRHAILIILFGLQMIVPLASAALHFEKENLVLDTIVGITALASFVLLFVAIQQQSKLSFDETQDVRLDFNKPGVKTYRAVLVSSSIVILGVILYSLGILLVPLLVGLLKYPGSLSFLLIALSFLMFFVIAPLLFIKSGVAIIKPLTRSNILCPQSPLLWLSLALLVGATIYAGYELFGSLSAFGCGTSGTSCPPEVSEGLITQQLVGFSLFGLCSAAGVAGYWAHSQLRKIARI